jgi:hypothetical protein
MGPMTNLRTAQRLFLDSSWIQIRTEFYMGPNFLSLKIIPGASLSLFLSAITKDYSKCYCISQITYTKPL